MCQEGLTGVIWGRDFLECALACSRREQTYLERVANPEQRASECDCREAWTTFMGNPLVLRVTLTRSERLRRKSYCLLEESIDTAAELRCSVWSTAIQAGPGGPSEQAGNDDFNGCSVALEGGFH